MIFAFFLQEIAKITSFVQSYNFVENVNHRNGQTRTLGHTRGRTYRVSKGSKQPL
jgi:hypothetical protein